MLKILPPCLLTAGILTPPFIMASTSATEPERRTVKQQYEPPLNGYQTRRLTALAPQPRPVITVDEFLYSQVSALLTHAPTIGDPAPYAIAARTAALQARQTPANLWYDIDATQFAYFGADAETPIGIAAVEATRGQVIQPDSPTFLAHNR